MKPWEWRAIDKVKGLTLGSTEKQALAVKQAERYYPLSS
ncbi:RepB [Limosilactobacillus fermentum F-6]|nr:RepB [Limosilactobacillus fermentum F-6]